jgi:hypothetical protein
MMRWLRHAIALLFCCLLASGFIGAQPADDVRFEPVVILINAGDQKLAAWQVELVATSGDVQIVGVEGGAHKQSFRDPPYYDPAALAGGRIIIASYTTGDAPSGEIHVATLHLRVSGDWALDIKPMAAADPAGREISVTATTSNGRSIQ